MKCLAVVLLSVSLALGQSELPPLLTWQANFGGQASDVPAALRTLPDGLLLGASSYSTNEVRSAPHFGSRDFWLIRLDASGVKLWDRSFGGNSVDSLTDIATDSSGFLLAGTSFSGLGGSKTGLSFGNSDFWIVRTGLNGDKRWDISFGGAEMDELQVVRRCASGGWILGGYSSSPKSAGKLSENFGAEDYWVIRIDDQGRKLWEKSYGGSGADQLYALETLPDGGFILGGSSDSPADGNKKSRNLGAGDFWVIRLDGQGQVLWEQTYGGTGFERIQKLVPLPTGNILVAGYTDSPSDENRGSQAYGGLDFWALEIRSDGDLVWENTYGGEEGDVLLTAERTTDGGFFLGGYSFSPISGSKSAPTFGSADLWVVRTDAEGLPLFDASYGGSAEEISFVGTFAPGGGFTFCGYSSSEPSGNKIAPNNGDSDIWLCRLAPEKPWLAIEPQATGSTESSSWTLQIVPGDPQQKAVLEVSPDLTAWASVYTNDTGVAQSVAMDEVTTNPKAFYRVRR